MDRDDERTEAIQEAVEFVLKYREGPSRRRDYIFTDNLELENPIYSGPLQMS